MRERERESEREIGRVRERKVETCREPWREMGRRERKERERG